MGIPYPSTHFVSFEALVDRPSGHLQLTAPLPQECMSLKTLQTRNPEIPKSCSSLACARPLETWASNSEICSG